MPPATAADVICLEHIDREIVRQRQRIALFLGEIRPLKNEDSTRSAATNAEKVCSGSVDRAEQFNTKVRDSARLCVTGSSYDDSQVVQLFKNATSTCRSELDRTIQTLPQKQQLAVREKIRQGEARLR
jgi:hypothetical protein